MGFRGSDFKATEWLKKFIDPLVPETSNRSGFQRAHVVDDAFAQGNTIS